MNNVSPQFIDDLRKNLEEDKRNTNNRIVALTAQDPFSDHDRVNDNAASDMEASEESDHDRVEAIIAELTSHLNDIDGALFRIADGSFGICSMCKTSIEESRLLIVPTATLCLKCETKRVSKKAA